jgi:hypothetical protein
MGNARRFAGSQFITLQSLKGRPSLHERIEFVTEEDGKYGQKLVVTCESGMRLSLNATSVGNLIRDIDTDFDNWVGHEVTVRAGEVDFQNGKADAILVEPIGETPIPAPTKTPARPPAKPRTRTEAPLPAAKKHDMDDEIGF